MVSIWTPVRRESSPIDRAAGDPEAAVRIQKIPLDPVVPTGCSIAGMTSQAENQSRLAQSEAARMSMRLTPKLLTAGGALGALAASSCCVVPLALFGLGVSGAWIGKLTQLAPYQPYFIAATAACLGGRYWPLSRSRKTPSPPQELSSRPDPHPIPE